MPPKRLRTPTRTIVSTNPPRAIREAVPAPKTWDNPPRPPAGKRR